MNVSLFKIDVFFNMYACNLFHPLQSADSQPSEARIQLSHSTCTKVRWEPLAVDKCKYCWGRAPPT